MTATEKKDPTFDFTVDAEPYSTTEHVLTPAQILSIAQLDPAKYYLVQIVGDHQESYKDEPQKEIHIHEHMKFISIYSGETPVS